MFEALVRHVYSLFGFQRRAPALPIGAAERRSGYTLTGRGSRNYRRPRGGRQNKRKRGSRAYRGWPQIIRRATLARWVQQGRVQTDERGRVTRRPRNPVEVCR